jgi:hypothetical protein
MSTMYTAPLEVDGHPTDPDHIVSYSKVDGGYVGGQDFAAVLEDNGICPQRRTLSHNVCSIGYNHIEKKWYGWSHRAIYGFAVGSAVSRGDCGYVPTDWDDLIDDAVRFWTEDNHVGVVGVRAEDDQGRNCVRVEWRFSDDIPNEKLRNTVQSSNMYPPDSWGRGEWTAETEADAKQMACDFAEGVS